MIEMGTMDDRDFYCLHSDLCKTLANDKRQMILGALRDGELTVSELQERTGVPQATLSQHLSLLRRHGVVNSRRAGAFVYYAIANPKIIQAFDLITEVMMDALASRQDAASRVAGAEITD